MPGNRKLGRTSDHRNAMLRGLVTYLIQNGQIETTYMRAKEVSALADKVITWGKTRTLASYRQILSVITIEDVARKLFYEIAPTFANVNGGYTAVYKLGPRRGDGAEMALIRLTAAADDIVPAAAEKKGKKKKSGEETAAPAKKAKKTKAAAAK